MRTKTAIKNIIFSLTNNIATSILGFISRTVFIYVLGSTYLGISGLLQNIFGLLAISELGLSTAIGFSLYKPLANNDTKLISILMTIYKKAYRIIGFFILFTGIIMYKYIDFFVDVKQLPSEITYIYYMYLINIVVGYFISYKQVLILSDQSSYKLVPIQMKINISTTIIQITYLIVFRNYIGYLSLQIISSIILNYIQNRYITKQYGHINFNSKDKLPKEEFNIIKKNVVGLMITKLGDFCVNSTDNLIISKFIDLVSVGLYSNYILLRELVNGYIRIIFSNITSSFGNLIAKEDEKKCLEIFDVLFFISFAIYSFEAVSLVCLYNQFIEIWIGKEYLFSFDIVLAIVTNNYLTGLRIPILTMKSAAGIYSEDAWVPFGFAIINLVSSIILVNKFGVLGVVIGSIIGSLLTADWYRPVVIFKKVFKKSVIHYFKRYILYLALGGIYMKICIEICNSISLNNLIINLIVKGIVCAIVPNLITIILFYKTNEFKYVINIIKLTIYNIKFKNFNKKDVVDI